MGLHHVQQHVDPFDTCPTCHPEDAPMGPTFDQIPRPHILEFIAQLRLTPNRIRPEYETLGSRPATHTRRFYATPVKGRTPLLSDDELLPEFHHRLTAHPLAIGVERAAHLLPYRSIRDNLTRYQDWYACVQMLDTVHTHVRSILNQRRWELREIANRLVNAETEEHILPLTATPYYAPLGSPAPPSPEPLAVPDPMRLCGGCSGSDEDLRSKASSPTTTSTTPLIHCILSPRISTTHTPHPITHTTRRHPYKRSKPTCWICGAEGHVQCACPQWLAE